MEAEGVELAVVVEKVGSGLLLMVGIGLVLGFALDLKENFCLGAIALRTWDSLSERALMCYCTKDDP